MSKISGKETKPEILVRKFLFANGFRYRKNDKRYPGKPDIVLPKYRTIVFINGCFWHGHQNCKKALLPESNIEFWEKKILQNIKRDKNNYKVLESLGWNVIVLWQCKLSNVKIADKTLRKLKIDIESNYESNG